MIEQFPIADLRPTQLNVGWWEVERRAQRLERKSEAELERYLARKTGRVVLGPGDVPFLIDGHHLGLALQISGASKTLPAEIASDWRHLSRRQFAKRMEREGAFYLYDCGRGPLDPSALPTRLIELTDDPYRSLAWAVRKAGGYGKWRVSFSEFEWANFFRARVALGGRAFDEAVEEATALARSSTAKGLPGYLDSAA